VSESQIRDDMQFLAGMLPDRGSNTDNERAAAEYIRDRLKTYTPDTEIDDFYSLDAPYYLFASYYAEFIVVSLVAVWWPRVALCYGSAVFLLYLAEFSGYRIMGRFLPQYETQNVAARFLAPQPDRTIVVMAHYDSGMLTPLTSLLSGARLRWVHFFVLCCMLIVILTCATDALDLFETFAFPYDLALRWAAIASLVCASTALFYAGANSGPLRGANDNASGVAVLLGLAEELAAKPIENADVFLVATGANTTWMHGARHFLTTHKFDRDTTYFIDITRVGQGALAYTTHQGMVHPFPCSPELLETARAVASEYGSVPYRSYDPCADALIPLAKGYKALGITAVPPTHQREVRPTDTLADIDSTLIAKAADFTEALLRRFTRA